MATPSRGHQAFAKPIGALCNLECSYCYYLQKQDLYPNDASFRMADSLLEEYIVQHIDASPEGGISFVWHGGEPTLLGLDYFRRIVALQRRHQPRGRRIVNSLQTNGTLLDEDWGHFLATEGFHVGLSLDGPPALHDGYRVAKGEKPTHRQVLQAYRLLRRHRILHDILCVVHAENVREPLQVYRYFKELKVQYLGFLPLVERRPDLEGGVSERSVSAEALGEFLCAIFDEWVRQDVGRITVQLFEEAISASTGDGPSLCIFRKTCGDVPVVEHNGDFFSCDHFVDPDHRVGNIVTTPLSELLESPEQRAFGEAKWETLPRYCRGMRRPPRCVTGDAPRTASSRRQTASPASTPCVRASSASSPTSGPTPRDSPPSGEPEDHPRASCRSFRPPMHGPAARRARNDPCPCGSGLKYKKCCLGKEPPSL